MKGLVYALTPKIRETDLPWYLTPGFLGSLLLVACVALNILFW
ncbi:MAG: hypothetical protein WDO13_07360 [Verrucomicrobiota bacterium]